MYKDEVFFDKLNKLIDTQLSDIEKCIKAQADILPITGCMNLIEFLGGISNGLLGKKGCSKRRFADGVAIINKTNTVKIKPESFWIIRCALNHQFIANMPDFPKLLIIGTGRMNFFIDTKGMQFLQETEARNQNNILISILNLLDFIKNSKNALIEELKSNLVKKNRANKCLYDLPELVDNL